MTTPNTDLAEQIRDAVAGALLAGEAYQCTRVWEAWMYKTMTDEDFVDASDGPLPEEVAAAVMPHVDAAVKAGKAEALDQFIRFAERHKDDALARNASDDEVYRWATVFTTAWNYRVQETPDEQ